MQHAALKRAELFCEQLFAGQVAPWVYVWLRVMLASVFLIRHSDWLEPWLRLEHHRWVDGLDFSWSTAATPALSSPLALGAALNETVSTALVWLRTLLALMLLFSLFPRAAALLLGLVSYALMASDRFHYLHHLHQLYLALLWLSLAPLGERRGPSPLWPLKLMRAFVVGIYLASGVAKLDPAWLSGDTLETLHGMGVVHGPSFDRAVRWLGFAAVAKLIVLAELVLALLLCLPRTRRAAVILGLAFHAGIESSMDVATFGAQMAILLVAFWPHTEKAPVIS